VSAPALPGAVVDRARELQQRAARPGTSAWVKASAGSGKTKVLSDRVLNLLLAGVSPQRILCLTFTRAAAAEMQSRIAERLSEGTTAPEAELDDALVSLGAAPDDDLRRVARRLFARVLDTPGGLRIMTIHAFCQSVLARFPLEAGVAPNFQVLDDRDADDLKHDAVQAVLAHAEARDHALAAAIAEVTRNVHETQFPELIAALLQERGRLARLTREAGGVEGLVVRIRNHLGLAPDDTPESFLAAACADAAVDALGLRLAVEALLSGTKTDKIAGRRLADWLAADAAGRAATFDDYALAFLTQAGEPRAKLIGKAALEAAPGADAILSSEAARLLAANDRRRAARVAQATAGLVRFGQALEDAYAARKAARALLDYDDLILATRRLLDSRADVAWVLYKLDGGIDHILIDEAQDTNPDQWAVVERLTDDFFTGRAAGDDDRAVPRSVFAVGDVKQSIYSFQRADPALFGQYGDDFARRIADAQGAWDDVPLDVSFRSTAPVLAAVDAVFSRAEARDGVVEGELVHLVRRQGMAGSVELWPPLSPRDVPSPPPWQPPVERIAGDSAATRLARLIARRIRGWLDAGEFLPARGRALTPGDVMVLVRRRGPFVDDLVRALKELDVAVAGVDRMVLTDQLAVMDLVALGRFLLLPEDDLTLATVLKCPIVGLDEEALFDLAYRREGRLWAELRRRRDERPDFAAAHEALAALLSQVDYRRPHELYAHLLEQGGRARILARLGPDAADPLDEFLAMTLAYERAHAPSLEGFLAWLTAGETEVKRDLEHGGDAVRVMTVHGAKGLQAPVVILPDTLQVPAETPRLLWPHDASGAEVLLWAPRKELRDSVTEAARDAAKAAQAREYRRLLYVAMTRAEDRLVVCGWQTRRAPPTGTWYELVRDALAPLADEVADPFLAASGEDVEPVVQRTSAPQTAEPEKERIEPPADATPLPAWATTPAAPEPEPPRPLAPSRPAGEEPTVRSPLDDDGAVRFQRGRLVHRLLELLPELPAADRAAACARYLARSAHGLTPEAQAALAAEVFRVLDAPDFAPLFAPGSAAEVPLAGVVAGADGRPIVVSGQVDRLALTAGAVLVVDYKTNRPPPATSTQVAPLYRGQMAAYRALLRDIYPDKTIHCALLWTDGPSLMPLSDALLDGQLPAPPDGAGGA